MSAAVKPGYKQTEAGLIPEDWEIKSGLDITSLISKGSSPKWQGFAYTNDGMLFVTSENVRNGYLDISQPKYLPLEFHEKLSRTKLLKNDILVNLVGASIGRSCQIRQKIGEANINQAVALLRFKDPSIASYIGYFLQEPATVQRILDMQADAARPNISLGNLRQFIVPIPPRSEQHAIATALSEMDALISSLDQLIAKMRDIQQAAMQQLLTGQRRLPGFSGEWSPIKMSKHSSLKARIGWQALTTAEYLDEGSYYLVTGTDFIDGRVSWSFCHFVDQWRYDQDRNIQLRDGDVLLTKDGTIGKVGYIDELREPATLNSGIFVIRPLQDAFAPLFLFYILKSKVFDEFLSKITAGSTIIHLYQKDFVTFEFLAPSLKEQTAIATILADMDTELATLEARRDKARQIKQGMMQELLTGRIRLI